MRNQIAILAAGQGKRMSHSNLPKVLVMLKNKPLILYVLGEIEKINQLAKPVIVVGFMHERVEQVLGEHYIYVLQEQQLGTAHALSCAQRQIRAENVLVLYGDMPFLKAESLKQLMRLHHKQTSILSMFITTTPNFEGEFSSLLHYGRIIRNFTGKLSKITEYKDASDREKQIKELNPGIYMFNTKWLWENIKQIKNKNVQKEYYLTDILEIAINQGLNIQTLAINPREVIGINSGEDLKLAESLI